jgi:hypothetical protein
MRKFCAGVAVSATILGSGILGPAAAPAFAAQQHKRHARLTAAEIIRKAIADFSSASSYRIYSSTSQHGKTYSLAELTTSQGCETTDDAAGVSMTTLIIGEQGWIDPSNSYWAALGYTAAQQLGLDGRWVTYTAFYNTIVGPGGPGPSRADCSTHATSGFTAHGWTLGRATVLNGRWVWQATNNKLQTSVVVSDVHTPEFLRITVQLLKGVPGFTQYFDDYNKPVTLTPPPASDVLTSIPPR